MRPGFAACLWLLLATAPLLEATPLRAQPLQVATFQVVGDDVATASVLDGTFDAQMEVQTDGVVRVGGGLGRSTWVRVGLAGADLAGEPILRVDRVGLERITAYFADESSGASALSDGFFRPAPAASLGPHSYAFALGSDPRAVTAVYLRVESAARVQLRPRLIAARDFHAQERGIAALLGASYAAIVVLMLSALSMYAALRDRAYLYFFALSASLLALLAALNGHLYHWRGSAWAGWWGANGVYALALVSAALALAFTSHFLHTPRTRPAQMRVLRFGSRLLIAVALLCLINPTSMTSTLQTLTGALGAAAAALILALALIAWRGGESRARGFALLWIALALVVLARVALSHGWLPPNVLTLYGFQAACALAAFAMSIMLAERVFAFRQQRDAAKQEVERSDASLQVEQVRRQFSESLRTRLRATTPEGDLEWMAFKRLLGSLRQVLPQQSSAVVAFGYHGGDLLLCEPVDARASYERLLEARGGSLKSLCRSRAPVQLQLDEARQAAAASDGDGPELIGGLFAVVPMPVPMPGWGALLVERSVFEPFEARDLALAADFLALAVAATDEAASQALLRRKADLDPLTAAFNRGAGETMLEALLQRAQADRVPLSLLLIELDQLKQINERHGHGVGDDALRRSADAVRLVLRDGEVLVRAGGEKFLVVLPGLAPDAARQRAEAIRHGVGQLRVQPANPQRLAVSIGVASRAPNDDDSRGILDRAERALDIARRNGRNQIQVAQVQGFGVATRDDDPPVML